MIHYYAACMAGPYHLDNEIPCQDSFYTKRINDNCIVAAVCDGLGSESRSDKGSFIVSHQTVEFCSINYKSGMKFDDVKKIMNNAFVYAYKAVLEEAANDGEPSDEYDTTVCLAIYDNGQVYYGQSGDSGMVALMQDGHYIPITEQQRDEDGYVYPLCSGPEKWVFGEVAGKVTAIMLMTDGVWEQICPRTLKEYEVKVNVPLTQKFMDRTENNQDAIGSLQESVYKYLDNYPRRLLDDDKTVVVVYNPEDPAQILTDDYYLVPNWKQIRDRAEENLYVKQDRENREDETAYKIEEDQLDLLNEDECKKSIIGEESQVELNPIRESLQEANETSEVSKKHKADDKIIAKNDSTTTNSKKKQRKPIRRVSKRFLLANKKQKKGIQKRSSDLIAIIALLCFSIFAFFMNGFVKEHAAVSCLGVFLVCFVANSTVLLPAPSILVVLEYSMIINPIAVAICGAIGASLGEMVGYLTGFKGRKIINSKLIKILEDKFPKHPYIYIFTFSALPLPIFDLIGVLAGAAKVDIMKFYMACVSGKTIKMLVFASLGKMIMQIIS